jgi:hypothetical protein
MPLFVLQYFQQLDGFEVGPAFLLRGTETDPILISDAVVVLVAERFWLD